MTMSSYVLLSSMASRTGVAELAVPTSKPASRSTAVARALTAGSSATISIRAAAPAACRPAPAACGAASRAGTAPEAFARAAAMTLLLSWTSASRRAMGRRVRPVPAIDVHRQEREDVAENHAVQQMLDQGRQSHGSRRVDRRGRQRHPSGERRNDDQSTHDPPRQAVEPAPQGRPDLVQCLGAGEPAEDSTDDYSVDQAGNPSGQRAVGMKGLG